jgi:uncharacterized protein YyaL (SSP411 family)
VLISVALATALVFHAARRAPPPLALLPGAHPLPVALQARLGEAAAVETGPPRTRHRNPDGSPRFTNRLVLEPSPYLRQHAHNPVDWYPWGDEAFARARSEGKPVLLSIGYSTCHWCHVMEEESFEDLEIAEYLNRHYVAIKVDRERRPDIDGIYMKAVQLMGEPGGWPLTVWLTPDRQPFYGGSYFPARDGDRGERVGFLTLLTKLRAVYDQRPEDVVAAAANLAGQIRTSLAAAAGTDLPGRSAIDRAVAALGSRFDAVHGGFGGAPKFPRPVELALLLRYARHTGDGNAREMAIQTLAAMAAGGVYDQVGGGFHRYATDAGWQVPHFEKMLYDNALLAMVYVEAYQLTGVADFRRVAEETLAYVQREMTDPAGGFFAASDADSAGGEGSYFVWTAAEMQATLTPEQWQLAQVYYDVTPRGNFGGENVLHTPLPRSAVAHDAGLDDATFAARLEAVRAELASIRARRQPPAIDRKLITAWNGLMISAFARGGLTFQTPDLTRTAIRAADHVLATMMKNGRLQRSALGGQASGDGYLDDYACMIAALLDLYEATLDPRWLRQALALERVVDAHFRDADGGGYFLTADDGEPLLAREKPAYDGPEPAGNSVMLLNLLRLGELTGDERFQTRADATLRAFAPTLADDPIAMPHLLSGLDFRLDRPKEIVIITPHDHGEAAPFLSRLNEHFVPNRVVAVATERERDRLAELVPLVAEKVAVGGQPTAYVCERRVCSLPTSDPDVFATQIEQVSPFP